MMMPRKKLLQVVSIVVVSTRAAAAAATTKLQGRTANDRFASCFFLFALFFKHYAYAELQQTLFFLVD